MSREKRKAHHIKVSRVVRKVIEEEVRKMEEEKISKDLDKIGIVLRKNLTDGEIVKAVRSARNER